MYGKKRYSTLTDISDESRHAESLDIDDLLVSDGRFSIGRSIIIWCILAVLSWATIGFILHLI